MGVLAGLTGGGGGGQGIGTTGIGGRPSAAARRFGTTSARDISNILQAQLPETVSGRFAQRGHDVARGGRIIKPAEFGKRESFQRFRAFEDRAIRRQGRSRELQSLGGRARGRSSGGRASFLGAGSTPQGARSFPSLLRGF